MSFPQTIDERIYFSDIRNGQKNVLFEYQKAYNNGEYNKATEIMSGLGGNYIGVDLMNEIEDQIIRIEQYINYLTKETFMDFSYDMPKVLKDGVHWISAKKELDEIPVDYALDASELYTNNETGLIE